MSRLVLATDEDVSFTLACLRHPDIRQRAEAAGCSLHAAWWAHHGIQIAGSEGPK